MRTPLMPILVAAALAASALTLPTAAAAAPADPQVAGGNLVETAAGDPRFTTLVSLVERAGLADELSGDADLTVFAPTDAAFAKVPAAKLRQLRRNRALLRKVLLYHVVPGDVKAEQVVQLRSVRTLAKRKVRIRVRDGVVVLNRRSKVIQTDIAASNGTIHVIDRVLLPPAR